MPDTLRPTRSAHRDRAVGGRAVWRHRLRGESERAALRTRPVMQVHRFVGRSRTRGNYRSHRNPWS